MKKLGRRNLATLTFIAVLAVIYIIILAVSRQQGRHDMEPPSALTVAVDTASNPPADSVAQPGGDKPVKPRRKLRKGRSKATVPDNPDIFDSPVPGISR